MSVKRRRHRASGFQIALRTHTENLRAWEDELGPYEYAQLLDVIARLHEHERGRYVRWLRRVA